MDLAIHLAILSSINIEQKPIHCLYMQHLLRVIPVIGILSDKNAFKPAPNADEVESVFDAPLEMFLKVFLFSSQSNFILISFFYLNVKKQLIS